MLSWIVIAAVLAVILLHFLFPKFYHWPSYEAAMRKIPGPPTIPYFGTKSIIGTVNEQFLPTLLSIINEYGPVSRIDVLGNFTLLLSDVNDIEIIMNSKSHITKSMDYDLLHPWLGTGLLTSTGDKWFSHRRLLTPAFHFGILEQYIEIFNNNAKILVDNLKSCGSAPVEINPFISMCTLDIVCETAMGAVVNAQLGGESDYVQSVLEMSRLFQLRQLSPWLYRPITFALSPTGRRQKKVLQTLHGFTTKVINERRESFRASTKLDNSNPNNTQQQETGAKERKSFLDLLVEISETEGKLPHEEIREEVDTFMFEGHDTTSAAINWVLFELGLNPDVQKQVHEELDGIFGGSERNVTSADIAEMKYLERVIKETLRLYPSVPFVARSTEKPVILSGYEVPANTNVAIAIFYIHRNPALYPDPDKFDPDRFLPENIANRHPYSYIPFSAGPRNCIGQKFAMMEEKVVLSEILRHLTVTSLTTRDDICLMSELVLRPKNNIKLNFTQRKKSPQSIF